MPDSSYHIQQYDRQIQEQKAILQSDATYRHRAAELELEKLEGLRENAVRNREARDQRERELQAQRDAAAKARQEQLASEERTEIWQRYRLANPAASEADFARAYPALLDDHRRQKMAEGDAAAREQMRRLVRRVGL